MEILNTLISEMLSFIWIIFYSDKYAGIFCLEQLTDHKVNSKFCLISCYENHPCNCQS